MFVVFTYVLNNRRQKI